MPDRIIHESATTSPTLDRLSDAAERTFWRMTTVVDDHGCFEADPTIMIAKAFPRRSGRMKPAVMERVRDELAAAPDPLVSLYEVNGRLYGQFVTWARHQRKRESRPKFPLPDDPAAVRRDPPQSAANGSGSRLARARSGVVSRESRDESRETQQPRLGGKPPPDAELEGFEDWYAGYPVKKDRGAAERAWAKLRPAPELRLKIAADVRRRIAEDADWLRGAVPYPATYLNGSRWNDDVRKPSAPPPRAMNGQRVYLSPTGKIWELEGRRITWLDQKRGVSEGYETPDGRIGIFSGGSMYANREAAEQAIRRSAAQRDEAEA